MEYENKFCSECGTPVNNGERFCPECQKKMNAANIALGEPQSNINQGAVYQDVQTNTGYMPMKWYKWVVYAVIPVNILAYLVSLAAHITGAIYEIQKEKVSSEVVYSLFPNLKYLDKFYAVASLVIAIMAAVIWGGMKNLKKNAWKKFIIWQGGTFLINLIYYIATSAILEEIAGSCSSLVSGAVMLVVNWIYFKKRDHLFVN